MHAKVNLENSIPSVKCISMFRSVQYNQLHSTARHTNGCFTKDAKKLMKNGCQCMTNRGRTKKERKKEKNKTKKNRTEKRRKNEQTAVGSRIKLKLDLMQYRQL